MALPYASRAVPLLAAPVGLLAGIKAFDKAKEHNRPITLKNLLLESPKDLAETPNVSELKKKWAPHFQ
jgi:hypothetical protein